MDRLAIKSEKTRMEIAIDKMYRDLKEPPRDLSDYSNFDDDYLDDLESLSADDYCSDDCDDSEEEDMMYNNEWDDDAEFIGGTPQVKPVNFNNTIPNVNENKYKMEYRSGYYGVLEFLNSNGPFEFLQIVESTNDVKIIYKLKKVEEK